MPTIPPLRSVRRESGVQAGLVQAFTKRGCMVEKTVSQSSDGWPDLTIITPKGRTIYVEVKDDNGTPSPPQRRKHQIMAEHHATIIIAYKSGIPRLISDYDQNRIPVGYSEYRGMK